MAENYQRQSPLDAPRARALVGGRATSRAGVCMQVRPYREQLCLRGDVASGVLGTAVQDVTGAALPGRPLEASRGESADILWLGPDEWLLVLAEGLSAAAVSPALRGCLGEEHHALVDVSSSRVAIGLAGERAREVLMKGCALDLHPRAFGPGRCDQGSLGRCHVLLHLRDDTPDFDIHVHRSFADYAWRWLEDAGREYGLVVAA